MVVVNRPKDQKPASVYAVCDQYLFFLMSRGGGHQFNKKEK